ncbi:MAG: hypothetical protein KME44_00850 [Candidatus Thiodiazotropha sp. (ex Lucina pensylvanica)]|nr:hypothetical protein [Candidatus Thiodiazotropha sp. (ex Lucina pensylvanica)]PUB78377.1 MAG: hypothetical protein DBO99_06965 [gamma proteobacterium symbiont of Ctena orbiculata]
MNAPSHKLFIPLVRQPPRETLLLSHPWFLRHPGAVPVTASPRLLQFTSDSFMEDFLGGVEASGEARDIDAFERLLTFRDYAEPPAAMLDEHGDPLYPGTLSRDSDPANALADGEEAPAEDWLRKLYLPLHCHFHIVSLALHCQRAGFPRVGSARVREAGMVIRRLVADRDRERWEDWIPVTAEKGVWLEIADHEMRPLGLGPETPLLDPQAIAEGLPALAETELRARAGLALDDPLPDRLQLDRLSPLSSAIGEAGKHSVMFGYLPLSAGAFQLPPFADPADLDETAIAALLQQRARDHLRAEWLDERPPNPGDAAAFVDRLQGSIQAPLRELVELLVLPDPPAADVNGARTRLESDWVDGSLVFHQKATGDADASVRITLQRALWLEADSFASLANWTASLEDRVIAEARARRPSEAGWNNDDHPQFGADVETLFRYHLREIIDLGIPATGTPDAGANDDTDLQHLHGALLLRIRACRKELLRQINQQVLPADEQPDLDRTTPESESAEADDYPLVTAGSLSDEIEAWLEADTAEARSEVPRPWPPLVLDGNLLAAHRESRKLEFACAEVDERGAAAGNAYLEECASRRQGLNDLLHHRVDDALLPSGSLPRSPGDELRIIGLDLAAQPEMGLLVFPGPAPTLSGVETMIDDVAGRYTTGGNPVPSVESQRAEAAQLLNLVRPRFDADSLYAVWCYARIAGRDACEAEQLLWTPGSEPFSLAEPTDILGMKPVAMQLPDLKKLVRDIPRIPKANANPFAAVNIPPDSGVTTGEEMADTARQWGIQMICSFGIPVFTICAWVLFSIILSILLMIPGFGWLLLLKFCLPVPVKK